MNNSTIIYRSRLEQDSDEFWHEHPDLLLWGFEGLAGLFVILIIVEKIRKSYYEKKSNISTGLWDKLR